MLYSRALFFLIVVAVALSIGSEMRSAASAWWAQASVPITSIK